MPILNQGWHALLPLPLPILSRSSQSNVELPRLEVHEHEHKHQMRNAPPVHAGTHATTLGVFEPGRSN